MKRTGLVQSKPIDWVTFQNATTVTARQN